MDEYEVKVEKIEDIWDRHSTPEGWPVFQEHLESREQQDEWIPPSGNPNASIAVIMGPPERADVEKGHSFGHEVHQSIVTSLLEVTHMDQGEFYWLPMMPFRLYRPDGKVRNPVKKEHKGILKYIGEQLEVVDPSVVIILGAEPWAVLRQTQESFSKVAKDFRIRRHLIKTPGTYVDVPRPAFVTFNIFHLYSKGNDRKGGDMETCLRAWLKAIAYYETASDLYQKE